MKEASEKVGGEIPDYCPILLVTPSEIPLDATGIAKICLHRTCLECTGSLREELTSPGHRGKNETARGLEQNKKEQRKKV